MKKLAISLIAAALLAGCGAQPSSTDQTAPSPASQSKRLVRSQKQAAASDYQVAVEALYLAYFGRPADPGGLVNFENALAAANAPTTISGMSTTYATNPALQTLINSFGTSNESLKLYGSSDPTAFVTAVFQNVLNRQPQTAGLNYWVSAISNGSLSQGDAALAIMAGAMSNTTTQGLLDAQLINNRLTYVSLYSEQVVSQNASGLYKGSSAAAGARSAVGTITATTDPATFLSSASAAVGALGTPSGNGAPYASLSVPASGKAPWNIPIAAQFVLQDASGSKVTGALSCSSATPASLSVAADCSSMTGLRLGYQTVTVGNGTVSSNVSVKVIPQAQPFGAHGADSSDGFGQYNLVALQDGRVLAWGANPYGVLGQGLSQTALPRQSLPRAVKDPSGQSELTGIVAVSAGTASALALTEDGEVYSWGSNSSNQLGRNALNGATLPGKVTSPTGSGTLQHIVAISIGDTNAVALGDDGTVYSWADDSGQSGQDPKAFPGVVASPAGNGSLGGAVAVSAGWNWSAALLANGQIVTWGYSDHGRLAQGANTPNPAMPGYVLYKDVPLTGIKSISAGYNFGLALDGTGKVYAWGDNSWGQIGQNSFTYGYYYEAVSVNSPSGASSWSGIKMVAAGGNQALAMDASGNVFSWGYSQDGELGDGANHPRVNQSALPAAVVNTAGIGQLSGARAIGAGYSYSVALMGDGSLLIWGDGFEGNLGQGGTNDSNSFVPLAVKNESGGAVLFSGALSYWPNLLQIGNF